MVGDLSPRCLEILVGIRTEPRESDVGDAADRIDEPIPLRHSLVRQIRLPPPLDRAKLDHVAGQGNAQQVVDAFPTNPQDDVGSLGPGDSIHSVIERPSQGGNVVHFRDAIAGLDSAEVGGRALERRDDHDLSFLVVANQYSHAHKAAPRRLLKAVKFVGPDDLGELIEAAHRPITELAVEHFRRKLDRLLRRVQ